MNHCWGDFPFTVNECGSLTNLQILTGYWSCNSGAISGKRGRTQECVAMFQLSAQETDVVRQLNVESL